MNSKHSSYFAAGNSAFHRQDYKNAIELYQEAKLARPELVHVIDFNIKFAKRRLVSGQNVLENGIFERIDIIVPIFNALEDVKDCLKSLSVHTDGFDVRVIVVNDGSDTETSQWLRSYAKDNPIFTLIEHSGNRGYTCAVNTGLKASTAPYVITQNSDTIVTEGWLCGLVRCMKSDSKLGIVGPLSNAATWQNVPNLRDESGSFAVNSLTADLDVNGMSQIVEAVSARIYPRLPFVNGFCFMIRRAVIDAIGYMDEINFPIGYGEENDYCIRAADAGFELAIADDVYVFHAKSKSFGHDRRKVLSAQGTENLRRKHGVGKFTSLVSEVKKTEALDQVRFRIKSALDSSTVTEFVDLMSMKILFLLPVKGGGGGAHSVVQEATEMRRLGIHAKIAVKNQDIHRFLDMYADIPCSEGTFVGFDDQSLLAITEGYDVVVGTIFTSMKLVEKVVSVYPHILPAYYVQDYEPLFTEEGSAKWKEACESYTLVPGACLFAKTQWIIDEVKRNHGIEVHKVQPSIDHEVYKPALRISDGRIHVAAMIRPKTPRRGAGRTMRLFKRLHEVHGNRIALHIFGCDDADANFQNLERNFPFVNHGILNRPQVAALLSKCDIFIDLSDYQAFGRTGLEAMACGCVSVVPEAGGANEYAVTGQNALVVNTRDEAVCFGIVSGVLSRHNTLWRLRIAGLITAARYSTHAAAISEWALLDQQLRVWRTAHPPYNNIVSNI